MKLYDKELADIDGAFSEAEYIKEQEKKARKEVRAENKERGTNYKFKLGLK